MSRAKRSLGHQMRHAQSMVSIGGQGGGASPRRSRRRGGGGSGGVGDDHAELALRSLDSVQRLRKKNEALEQELSEALGSALDAEERARRAEAESAHQRERMQGIAAEADEEIAMLRQRILELEAEQQQVHKNGGDQAQVRRAHPKQRRTSYVQRFGQDFGGKEGGGDGELETASKRSVVATAPQVDAGQLLLAMRHLVKLSKDIIDVTEPGDYADELS